jgi:hypothetical protein
MAPIKMQLVSPAMSPTAIFLYSRSMLAVSPTPPIASGGRQAIGFAGPVMSSRVADHGLVTTKDKIEREHRGSPGHVP